MRLFRSISARIRPALLVAGLCCSLSVPALAGSKSGPKKASPVFERVATFPVFLNTNAETETVAEIVAATDDGRMLVYTDSANGGVGLVDIEDPQHPLPAGTIAVDGEPTSVAIRGRYALVGVNTSVDYKDVSGWLVVIDIPERSVVARLPLGGQPDSVAISPDGQYAAVAIENERDEDLEDGAPPQAPAGYLIIVDLFGEPGEWNTRRVGLTGIAEKFADDPEPEYVSINNRNIAALSLQENNHIILIDLPTGTVLRDFSAGQVELDGVDTTSDQKIDPGSRLSAPREPDGLTWIGPNLIATADEGDLDGGGRGFTIFDLQGRIRYTSGKAIEDEMIRLGHYPEKRAGKKGNEPENVAYARFGRDRLLFVGSERSSVVLVYRVDRSGRRPVLLQVLPTGVAPEGLLALPERNLFIAAAEKDDRAAKFRSGLTIYQRRAGPATWPSIRSADGPDGRPLPWGALSGLSHTGGDQYCAIADSFYRESRILFLEGATRPATITGSLILRDTAGMLTAVAPGFVNEDATVNLDPEGIAAGGSGEFWIASEGSVTPDPENPEDPEKLIRTPNLLLRAGPDGGIREVVTLPAETRSRQVRFGLEGVAMTGLGKNASIYVAFQRPWIGDPAGMVRIGRYRPADGSWRFFYYPLDEATSPAGGWVGLSEITALGGDSFAVIERDNQGGTDARIKRIYRFSIRDLTPGAEAAAGEIPAFPLVSKVLVRDLLGDLQQRAVAVPEKIEGLAVRPDGTGLVVNDNDGVDDSNGETTLLILKELF